jgi:futalosine hydrolase
MSHGILIVAATKAEAEVVDLMNYNQVRKGGIFNGGGKFSMLVTGVGSFSTSWEMLKWISRNEKPRLALNIGIAGSYNREISIGDVVMPVTDCFADAGIEEGSRFLTLFEAGLAASDEFPFTNGVINADPRYIKLLSGITRPVKAITVNSATGSNVTRDRLKKKYKPDIETMEGATFFYICSKEGIPFIALRSVSNMVESRNKSRWDIRLALTNLANKLDEVVLTLGD